MKQRFFKLLFIGLIGLQMTACDANRVFEENQAVENNSWKSEDIKTFSFDVTDTISPLNIYINLRTTTDYQYSNIYLFMYSVYPNGTSNKDTLEFLLAKPDGQWLGDNSGTVVEFKGLIASGGRFSTAGTYKFQLQHAMRETELAEIIDVGMRVETMDE